ncbi:AEC family transporter [Bacillaceae bacterium SIJ1]|nr:AEC family transporter [Litoribacterium kuwaitense]
MQQWITIFFDVLCPVFILVLIGVWLQRKFSLDMYTLSKLNIYFLVPGIIFTKLYETALSINILLTIAGFTLLLLGLLYLISNAIAYLFRFSKSMRVAFSNSVIFYNSGNYGVPVNDLVFKQDPFAMSIQVIVLLIQNITTFSYGIFALQSNDRSPLKALLSYLRLPVLYAMLSALVLNMANIQLPDAIYLPATYISDAVIAIALITLGCQVAQLRLKKNLWKVYSSVSLRLLLSPALAAGILFLFDVQGVTAQAFMISAAMPTSVNSAIIAQEYKNEPEFSAQAVLASTICSALTVTLVIYISGQMF